MSLFHRKVNWYDARRCQATYGKVNWRCVREAGHKDEHIAWGKGAHPWCWSDWKKISDPQMKVTVFAGGGGVEGMGTGGAGITDDTRITQIKEKHV